MTALRTRPAVEPLPTGFGVQVDRSTEEVAPGVLVGGRPLRVLRLSEAGRAAFAALGEHAVTSPREGRLARRLTDAGLAHPVPPPDPVPAALTVVVPVHGRAQALDRCLESVGDGVPVVVVDDGSPDPAAVAAVARRHGATLVRLDTNQGPAAARNAGLRAVDADLVAFVDSDVTLTVGCLGRLAAHLRDPLVAAAAARIRPLTPPGGYAAARSPLDLGGEPALVRPYTAVSYVPTAVLLARRAALAEPGPFDPALRYGEDVDLVWRLVDGGWRVRYVPEAAAGHEEPAGWPRLLARRFRYGTSAAPLARRHPGNVAPFVVHPWFTATAIAALAGRPVLALGAAAGAAVSVRRLVRRAGLPRRRILRGSWQGIWGSYLGLARWATQTCGPLLVLLACRGGRRRRWAATALLLGPALTAWRDARPQPGPVRFCAGYLADEMSYGFGVLAGCVRHRTTRPLRPRRTRRSF